MKKKKALIGLIVLLLLLVLLPLGLVVVHRTRNEAKERAEKEAARAATLAPYSDYEILEKVPVITGNDIHIDRAEDFGDDNYGVDVYDLTKEDYDAYLLKLEKEGFKKYVDNGEEGLDGYVYTAQYLKGDLLVVVSYFPRIERGMISASEGKPLSTQLFYDEKGLENNIPGAKTTMHMPELYYVGNSFIIQLKNGHFILNDGGSADELPYLLDYLDSLTPEGQKPVVDAWFITHSHSDHIGVFDTFMDKKQYIERLYVENVYFNESSQVTWDKFLAFDNPKASDLKASTVPKLLKNTEGKSPEVYRIHIGEKYYFNDITVDVLYTHDMLPAEKWHTYNGASTWLMYNIEGQKVLLTADGEWDNMQTIMSMYDSSYFELDIYQAAHHGASIWDQFTDYLADIGTVVYPAETVETGGANHVLYQSAHLRDVADESYSFGDGGKVFTFPYQTGTVKKLPLQDWKYNASPPERYKQQK